MFNNLLDSDVERLHVLITRHAKATGSKRAADILANWKDWLPKFRKVMPVEYRRALREMAANAGMLFDLHRPQFVSFWMKNTYLPLDLLFLG